MLFLNKAKPKERKGKVLLVNASQVFEKGDPKNFIPEAVSQKIRQAFTEFPNWKRSENAVRELRTKVTFAIFAETDNLDQVTAMVDDLFKLLEKASRI